MTIMYMSFRWFGKNDDSIPLPYVAQIPVVKSVVTSLLDIPVGDVWPLARIMAVKREIEDQGLRFDTVESLNVHEDIKLGAPTRDGYIENYRATLRNLSQAGVKVVCYNFMPVFDYIRTDAAKVLPDGSTAMYFDDAMLREFTPDSLMAEMEKGSNGFTLPGWESSRMGEIKTLFDAYKTINEEKLFETLGYFLEAIIPVAAECDIKMAMHPDDPPWSIFGLPRIMTCRKNLDRMVNLVDSPYNGLTLCSGSLGADPNNDVPSLIRHFGKMGRIHFAHVRNIKISGTRTLQETAHQAECGSLDICAIMKAYHDIGFEGPMRPDHGRMIWGEKGRPGYGLYDRALGAVYLQGLWDAMERASN
jgi:mannonate dehydratase